MRTGSTICKIGMWVTLVIYAFFQMMAIYGIQTGNNASLIAAGRADEVYSILPLLCVTLLMILAVVLFAVWKKRRYIGVAVALVAAVAIVVVALDLSRAFPVRISSYDTDPGLSTWKMIWRHAGMALVPVFMIPAWLLERADLRSFRRGDIRRRGRASSGGGGPPAEAFPAEKGAEDLRQRVSNFVGKGGPADASGPVSPKKGAPRLAKTQGLCYTKKAFR